MTAIVSASPKNGPAVTFTDLIPDLDPYHGKGGQIASLWRGVVVFVPNVKTAQPAHPACIARFKVDLICRGFRDPIE